MASKGYRDVYNIVNTLVQQDLGLKELSVIDETGLIALGNTVLSSQTQTDIFLNSLVKRIGKTIIASRRYESRFKGLMQDDFKWGAILQKISFGLMESQTDPAYNLIDGQSVDHYKVNKPKVKQALFTTETPYMFNVSIQDELLQEAFLSENAMGSFIEGIFETVQNSIEVSLESLGRNCLNNYIAEVSKENDNRHVNLLALYNAEHTDEQLTVDNCITNDKFLRFTVEKIKWYSDLLEGMNNLFNSTINDDTKIARHTPKSLQHMYVLSSMQRKLETVVQYAAFNDDYVKLENFEVVPYWQALVDNDGNKTDGSGINVKRASDNEQVEYNSKTKKVVACLFDERALGIYKKTKKVATTPINAFGLYYNTSYHLKEMYFNDLTEQFIVFTIE